MIALIQSLRTAYEASRLEVATRSHLDRQRVLNQYVKTLGVTLADAKQKGDLKAYTAVDEEQKRVTSEGTVPKVEGCPSALGGAVRAYHRDVAAAEGVSNSDTARLLQDYVTALEGLVKELVQAGRIEDAKAAQKEYDEAAALLKDMPPVNAASETKGIYSNRSPAMRSKALGYYRGSGATEAAVYRSLRWLKKCQERDGSWTDTSGGGPGYSGEYMSGHPTAAMTGFALLTFLAHGETPQSAEFGKTVQRALDWLVKDQMPDGRFKNSDGNGYSLPIATYALCEAYAMTKNPTLLDSAVKSLKLIVEGQTSRGLWDYNCKKTERSDLSYGGWCVQAVKAGLAAGLDVNGLKGCAGKAVVGLRNHHGAGGFDYGGPGRSKVLSGTGTFCMQLLGAGRDAAVADTVKGELKVAVCDWERPTSNPLYSWYYTTQAKFFVGGETWSLWNRQLAGMLATNQVILPKEIEDANGQLVDVGYWQVPPSGSEHCRAYVYCTALCTLMLEAYYRYTPISDARLYPAYEIKQVRGSTR